MTVTTDMCRWYNNNKRSTSALWEETTMCEFLDMGRRKNQIILGAVNFKSDILGRALNTSRDEKKTRNNVLYLATESLLDGRHPKSQSSDPPLYGGSETNSKVCTRPSIFRGFYCIHY